MQGKSYWNALTIIVFNIHLMNIPPETCIHYNIIHIIIIPTCVIMLIVKWKSVKFSVRAHRLDTLLENERVVSINIIVDVPSLAADATSTHPPDIAPFPSPHLIIIYHFENDLNNKWPLFRNGNIHEIGRMFVYSLLFGFLLTMVIFVFALGHCCNIHEHSPFVCWF